MAIGREVLKDFAGSESRRLEAAVRGLEGWFWLRRDKNVASPLGGALGLMVVWLLRRRGASSPGVCVPSLGDNLSLVGKLVVPAWEMARTCLGIFCTCLGIRGLRLGILVCPPGAGSSYRGKSDLVTLVTFESYRGK